MAAGLLLAMLSATPAAANADVQWTYFVNMKSGLCLGISGGNMANGTAAAQWTCNGHTDQYWVARCYPDTCGWYDFLLNCNSGKVAGVASGFMTEGARLVQWSLYTDPIHWDQWWEWWAV